MNYLSTLNEKQSQAVRHTEGYLRVIAGAGSGKTKLLVSRYAYLVKEYGIDSANILCVTFTNKAAGEMKRRIRAIIGQEYDTSLICTYHGFCVRVLREDVEKIFYPKEFQIIDAAQQKSILGEIYQKYELKLDHGSFEKILKLIARKKSDRKYVEKMCRAEKCQILGDIKTLDDQIVEEYLQRQKQIYAMDFNDLMYFTIDIFKRCPEVLAKWQDRLNYIQVDEFQDSSRAEMQLVDMLSQKHKNLMIVGDPDQNIYEWRGSDVKLLVDFDKRHIPTKDIILNQNYRSTPQILKCANALIDNNVYRLKKDLFTLNNDDTKVHHYHTKNEYEEAEKIIDIILKLKKTGKCNFSDFAVLYRSGFLSRIIEKKFTENGIPYEIFGGVKFYNRMEIQDIMAYLRLIAFDDDVSFKRIVNTPRRRFGRVKLQKLQMLQTDKSLYETLKENIADEAFKNSGASEFVAIIEKARKALGQISLYECVDMVCTDSGYEKYIRELGDMERFENLSEFKRIAAEYESSFGEKVSLKEFINQISLQSEDDAQESQDMVKLMTVHAAKGLEFQNVFVVGLSEGIFPSAKTVEERKEAGLEEERRLCYVAITRAERRLFLMDSEGLAQNGKQKIPSRFLKEIGEENYVRFGALSKELKKLIDNFSPSAEGKRTEKILTIGKKVVHPAFGDGEIVGYGKNGNSYVVKFSKLASERVLSKDFFAPDRSDKKSETSKSVSLNTENRTERSEPIKERGGLTEPEAKDAAFPETEAKDAEILSNEATKDAGVPRETSDFPETEAKGEGAFQKVEAKDVGPSQKVRAEEQNGEYKRVEDKIVPEMIQKQNGAPSYDETPAYDEAPSGKNSPRCNDGRERDDIPKGGWECTGITDLGTASGFCQYCGQTIRYVHHMHKSGYGSMNVGCVCAGKLEGNIEKAKLREQEYKNKQARRESFKKRKWKKSKNNNSYLAIKNHLIVLYYSARNDNWKYSIDNKFSIEVFSTRDEAMDGAFEALENKLLE